MSSIDIDRSPASAPVCTHRRVAVPSVSRRARAADAAAIVAAAIVATATALAAGCLPALPDVQCLEDASCNRFPGGACRPTAAGHRWCSYPDLECPSGYRHSDFEVGDGASGACTAITHDLTITVEGDGAGLVSALQGDFTCASGTCTRSFLDGERIDLSAAPSAGAFLGWSQSCQGPGPCELVMDRDRTATALFGTPGHTRWVRQIGGPGWDRGYGITADPEGNLIAVGSFQDSMRIDGTTLTSAGSYDTFVIKLNGLTGGLIWAKRFGGQDYDSGGTVRIDTAGNIYVLGIFYGTANFGGGPLQSAGSQDIFLLKLTADGDHVWSRRVGGQGNDSGDLAVRDEAVAIVGSYQEGAIVDGTGPASLGYSMSDIFIMRLTTDGEIVWTRSLVGTSPWDVGAGVAIDSVGNVIVVGGFGNTVDFGGWPLTASGSTDIFVAKYAGSTGAHLFSRRYGGVGEDVGSSVAVDARDNIVISGYFTGTVDFGGPAGLSAVSSTDIFVTKYTLSGAYLWGRSFGATSTMGFAGEYPRSMVINGTDDIMIAGQFCGTISLGGPAMSSSGECSTDTQDSFVAHLDSATSNQLHALRAGGRSSLNRIAVASDNRLYAVGYFEGLAELGGRSLTTSTSSSDAFILALAPL